MKKNSKLLLLLPLLAFFVACEYGIDITPAGKHSAEYADGTGSPGNNQGSGGAQAGVVTAAEWNDLDNWTFWTDLINDTIYNTYPPYWKFYPKHRVAIRINHGANPVINAALELKKGEYSVWKARTDNLGRAEMWISLFQKTERISMSDYVLYIDGKAWTGELKSFDQGWNEISLSSAGENSNRVELAFVVDATGSMADELEFLKSDLQDVLDSVSKNNSSLSLFTGAVFYRDEGDEYVVKHSDFTAETATTIDYIGAQRADAGGDYPEAVHTALNTTLTELQWSEQARTRIAFLLLDAPPHYTTAVISSIHASLQLAAAKGIKIIPITASGIDKETEFLMRLMAMTTNGTYVFITNDSGVGNDHLQASVGEYQVELLNKLMVRLINKYTE